jgi:predicted helicase
MGQTIHDVLEIFREEAANNRDLGDKFERLMAAYLTKDPYFANHFSDVWLWTESTEQEKAQSRHQEQYFRQFSKR